MKWLFASGWSKDAPLQCLPYLDLLRANWSITLPQLVQLNFCGRPAIERSTRLQEKGKEDTAKRQERMQNVVHMTIWNNLCLFNHKFGNVPGIKMGPKNTHLVGQETG